jgi:hypothetical protein
MEQKRGQLTQRIKDRSLAMMGREITQEELRLMSYAQYVMVNEQRIDPNKISQSEREILRLWKDAGYMEGGASGMTIIREFWDILCEMVFLGYVDID